MYLGSSAMLALKQIKVDETYTHMTEVPYMKFHQTRKMYEHVTVRLGLCVT